MRTFRPCCCLLIVGLLAAADVTSLTLINADTDQPIAGYDPLPEGATLDLGLLPTANLNLRANVGGSVGSVRFAWSGTESGTQTESTAPYAMKGDASGDYTAWTPSLGSYSVTCTPYVAAGAGGGLAGSAHTRTFTVTAGGSPPPLVANGNGSISIGGERKLWHRVDLSQAAVGSSEQATPNPFLDYRFNVTFTAPSGKKLLVPGYFATDGLGGDAGNLWRAHLNPGETGTWSYLVSFRTGTDVAVSLVAGAGSPVAPFDGKAGTFTVTASDKSGDDFRAADKGLLVNRNAHYLTYAASGRPFIFTGPGIPENILGYRGFTNTSIGIGHTFEAHLADWKPGDPDWNGGAGRKLIGALNYIADNGGNSLYLMSNTIGGDAKDCFPHPTSDTTKTRYDLLKLQQWDLALAHAQKKGIYLHWVLAETEVGNYTYYGGTASSGSLSTARKLSFRMLNARFGHYNGLKWNLCEEIEWNQAERTAQMAYLHAVDPYDHPVTFQGGGAGLPWTEFDKHLGDLNVDALSFQGSLSRAAMFDKMKEYRDKSAANGVKWTVAWDEPQKIENDNGDEVNGYPMGRHDKMWPCLMGGGDGFLWYIQADGGGHGFDQRIEDFTIMRNAFRWSGFARDFLEPLPLTEMTPSRTLVTSAVGSEDYCLAKPGEVYAIYNDRAGTGLSLDLGSVPASTSFTVRWFDPRNGGALQAGSVATVSGGGLRNLGNAPTATGSDWAVLVSRSGSTPPVNQAPSAQAGPDQTVVDVDGDGSQAVALNGSASSDADGSLVASVWKEGSITVGTGLAPTVTLTVGVHILTLTVTDDVGATATDSVVITLQAAPTVATLRLDLINAVSDLPVPGFAPLADGASFDLTSLGGPGITLAAVPSTSVGSVVFTWSGPTVGTQSESAAPYAIAGDTSGDFKPWAVSAGTYTITATAYSASKGGGSVVAAVSRTLILTEGGGAGGPAVAIAINFQPALSPDVEGWLVDSGQTFASRNGQQYGWNTANPDTRDRNAVGAPDQRHDTLIHLQKSMGRIWELALPTGLYQIRLLCGDPSYVDQVNTVSLEGVIVTDPDGPDAFDEHLVEVTVSDGRLTLTAAAAGKNAKVCAIEVVGMPTASN